MSDASGFVTISQVVRWRRGKSRIDWGNLVEAKDQDSAQQAPDVDELLPWLKIARGEPAPRKSLLVFAVMLFVSWNCFLAYVAIKVVFG